MTSIRSIGGVEYSNWEEVYSIDFSDYDSEGAMVDEDQIKIDGVEWQAYSSSYGGCKIAAGTGLILEPQVNSKMYGQAPNVPYLFAAMQDLVPNLAFNDTVCMQWVHDYTASSGDQEPDANFETVGAQIWDGGTDSSWRGLGIKGIHINELKWCPFHGTVSESPNADADKYRAFEVVWNFVGQTAIVSSPAASVVDLSDPLVMKYKREWYTGAYGTNNAWVQEAASGTNRITSENACAMLYSYTEGAAARGFKGIFTKFRVFRSRAS